MWMKDWRRGMNANRNAVTGEPVSFWYGTKCIDPCKAVQISYRICSDEQYIEDTSPRYPSGKWKR